MNDPSAQIFAIALAATWCGFGLYGVLRKIERSPQARELLLRFRRARLSTKAAIVAGLVAGGAILFIGFFNTLFILLCGTIGLFIGSRFDSKDDLVEKILMKLDEILPEKIQRW